MGQGGLASPCSLNSMWVILRALQSSRLLARQDAIPTLGFSPTNWQINKLSLRELMPSRWEVVGSVGGKVKAGHVGKDGNRENEQPRIQTAEGRRTCWR